VRVLFATSELPTHYFPMVPLAWAFQSAGHEVRMACPAEAAQPICRAGITPLPLLDGPDQWFKVRLSRYWALAAAGRDIEPGEILHPVTGECMNTLADFDIAGYAAAHREDNIATMRASCDRMAAFARAWGPDLVISEPNVVEGVFAATLLGVPAVCHLFGPVGTHETGDGLNIVLEDHSESFARYDLPEMGPDRLDYVIDPCPAAIAGMVGAARLPMRHVAYNGPGTAPAWLTAPPESGRPRVLVSWSTVIHRTLGPRSFRLPEIVAGLADLDVEVVLAVPADKRDALGRLPDNARPLTEWAPLNQILPACAALVHHGGAGNLTAAMVAGTAQLATGFTAEQRTNGERLAQAGAGLHQDGYTFTADSIRDGVLRLLTDDALSAGVAALRSAALALPSPAALVSTLAGLA
jgi:UDP:flavonoid glycosyltransferase YjiC (YdhE family)